MNLEEEEKILKLILNDKLSRAAMGGNYLPKKYFINKEGRIHIEQVHEFEKKEIKTKPQRLIPNYVAKDLHILIL